MLTCLATHSSRPGFGSRFQIFMLLDRMIIWEFVQRHEGGVALRDTTLRARAGRYIDMLQKFAPEIV